MPPLGAELQTGWELLVAPLCPCQPNGQTSAALAVRDKVDTGARWAWRAGDKVDSGDKVDTVAKWILGTCGHGTGGHKDKADPTWSLAGRGPRRCLGSSHLLSWATGTIDSLAVAPQTAWTVLTTDSQMPALACLPRIQPQEKPLEAFAQDSASCEPSASQ